MIRLILASGSSVRQQIMKRAGLAFEVVSRPVDEAAIKTVMLKDGARFRDIADALAEAKSRCVSLSESGIVIGVDQIMAMDGILFDKPEDSREAHERLKSMRGKMHRLIGAIVICEDGRPTWRYISENRLYMRRFSDAFLNNYIEMEKDYLCRCVGGYRFEGLGVQLFDRVEGDFFSILGLCLLPLLDYLRTRGAILS